MRATMGMGFDCIVFVHNNASFVQKQRVPMIARNCIGIVPVVVLILSFAFQAPAADFTFFIGGLNPGSIDFHDEKVSLDGGPVFGLRVGTNFVPSFGVEHTIAFSSDFLFPGNVEGVAGSKGFLLNSNLLFSLPAGKMVPYVTAGIGLVHQYGSSDLPVGTKPAFNYGGGVKLPHMKGPFGLRFDIRGYRIGFVTNTVNMLEISGGLIISTGK
jgi:hypothetical protein